MYTFYIYIYIYEVVKFVIQRYVLKGFMFFFYVPSSPCSLANPRMTKGAKGPKESEDTDAAATAAPDVVEQISKVDDNDDTDPRLQVFFGVFSLTIGGEEKGRLVT